MSKRQFELWLSIHCIATLLSIVIIGVMAFW